MQEEKSVIYTVILGVCMLICLFLMGKMLLGRAEVSLPPAAEGDTASAFPATEGELEALLKQAMPFPIEQAAVSIGEDGVISAAVSVRRDALSDSGLVPSGLRTALLFLPEQCRLYGEWTAVLEDGILQLSCRTVTIEGVELPEDVVQRLNLEWKIEN